MINDEILIKDKMINDEDEKDLRMKDGRSNEEVRWK